MRERAPQKYIFFRSQNTCYICIHKQCSSLLLLIVWRNKRQYTDKTLTLKKSLNMRASELGNFCTFILKTCYFFQYFVGNSDTLSVQMTWLSAYTYWKFFKCTDKTQKGIIVLGGGGGGSAYASVRQHSNQSDFISGTVGQSHAVL